jgi:hypothetical protein
MSREECVCGLPLEMSCLSTTWVSYEIDLLVVAPECFWVLHRGINGTHRFVHGKIQFYNSSFYLVLDTLSGKKRSTAALPQVDSQLSRNGGMPLIRW